MNNRRISISGFLMLSIVAGICFLIGSSYLEAAPRIISEEELPDFHGGVHIHECAECDEDEICEYTYDQCSCGARGEGTCNYSWETQGWHDGYDSESNPNTDAHKDDWGYCAERYKCIFTVTCKVKTSQHYSRYSYRDCDTEPR